MLLLMVLTVAGGAFLYHARLMNDLQRNRRAALVEASDYLEDIRSAAFSHIAPPGGSGQTTLYYLEHIGTNWVHHLTDPGLTATIDGQARACTATVVYADAAGGGAPENALRVEIRMAYHRDANEMIRLETLVAPWGAP